MFPFSKNQDSRVPQWVNLFTEDEYAEFMLAIEGYFKAKNINYKITDGVLNCETDDENYKNLGLMNLAQDCKSGQIKDYPQMVANHFEALEKSQKFERDFSKKASDFDQIKEYLAVKLYPMDYVDQLGKKFTVGQDFSDDIYMMLVLDAPDSIRNVKPDEMTQWGKNQEELFEIGKQNIKAKYTSEISEQPIEDFKAWLIQGEHFFTSNILFDLNNHPKLVGSKGSLVAIPTRHTTIVYPIENLEVLKAINQIIPIAFMLFDKGPGSISRNIFWYQDGQITQLPYTIENQNINFAPPQEFIELLNGLPPENK